MQIHKYSKIYKYNFYIIYITYTQIYPDTHIYIADNIE